MSNESIPQKIIPFIIQNIATIVFHEKDVKQDVSRETFIITYYDSMFYT